MKKLETALISCLLSHGLLYAQTSQLTETSAEDHFEHSKELATTISQYGKVEKGVCVKDVPAQRGIFWSTADGSALGFVAYKYRDTTLKKLEYTITEYIGGYTPLTVSFGEYCERDSVKSFTLDLRKNALLELEIENPKIDDYEVNIRVWLTDINGKVLSLDNKVLNDFSNWPSHLIGFLENHKTITPQTPSYSSPGSIQKLSFDFKKATTYKKVPFSSVTDLYADNSYFDFSKVKSMSFEVTNLQTGGENGFQPLDLIEKKLNILNFTLGVDPVVTHISTEKLPVLSENTTVYDMIGNRLFEGNSLEVNAFVIQQPGLYILKTKDQAYKIITF